MKFDLKAANLSFMIIDAYRALLACVKNRAIIEDSAHLCKGSSFNCGGSGDERHRSLVDEALEYKGVLEKD